MFAHTLLTVLYARVAKNRKNMTAAHYLLTQNARFLYIKVDPTLPHTHKFLAIPSI